MKFTPVGRVAARHAQPAAVLIQWAVCGVVYLDAEQESVP
jgi:hypothetical protein